MTIIIIISLVLYSVYDQNHHLCHFDTGLVEKNVELYFSGWVKPIYDENPDPSGITSTLVHM